LIPLNPIPTIFPAIDLAQNRRKRNGKTYWPIELQDMGERMITACQIRAGRALLDWTQKLLADRALVAVNTLRAVEKNETYTTVESVAAIRNALVKAGIVFLSDGVMGEGVRLSKPVKKSS
jgi:DNA-binding XRE family transcriptional regulator